MKLSIGAMPYSWAEFHTSVLDETDDDQGPVAPVSSALAGLSDYVSEVRIRAAVRAGAIAHRARRVRR